MENAQAKIGVVTENHNVLQNNEFCQEPIQSELDTHDRLPDVKDGRCDKKDKSEKSLEESGTDHSQEDVTVDSQVCEPKLKRFKKDLSDTFCGTHEIQVSEGGEADLHKHLVGCKKNPGHKNFIPVNDFNINHLPKGYHDTLLVDYIKAIADLTVRLAVKMTSTERPEFDQNTKQPYPFYDKRGSDVMRLGTGTVAYIITGDNKEGTCPCHKCQHSDTPSKVWGEVLMSTARHVVFDDLEARHTTCRLFFDRKDSPMVTLDGWKVTIADVKEDRCDLGCVTCDVDLLDKLKKMVDHWWDLRMEVKEKYDRPGDKLTLIVSHPHGCPKQISVGHWIDRDKVSYGRTKYTYTTCTCPGSSGAYVHTLGNCIYWMFVSHVHCGVNSEGRNYCGIGWEMSSIM